MMKRNILAVVIPALLAAGAANAAEIYNKDGNKLDLYGKVDGLHYFSDDKGNDGDQTYVRFGFKGETQITDQLTGYGQWEYNVQANNSESQGTEGTKTRLRRTVRRRRLDRYAARVRWRYLYLHRQLHDWPYQRRCDLP